MLRPIQWEFIDLMKGMTHKMVNTPKPLNMNQQLKDALFHQEQWVLDILEQIPIGVFAKNWTDGRKYFFWNRKMEEIFQIPRDQALGYVDSDVFKDRSDTKTMQQIDGVIARTGKTMEIPAQEIFGLEQKTTVRIKKVPICKEETNEVIILGIIEDITLYKKNERKLLLAHQEREELEQIINLSPVVLFLFRDEQSYPLEFVSENVWRFGFQPSFFMEEDAGLLSFVGQENEELFRYQIRRFNAETPEVVFPFYRPEGERWYEVTLRSVNRQLKGSPLIQGIFTDITEKRQIQDELAKAKDLAEAANEAKSRFLATVTHELRTPLNGILGMVSLVLDTPLQKEQNEFLGLVKYSAENLLQIINDILDFSKVEAGQLVFEWIPVCPMNLIDKSLRTLKSLADKRGLSLNADIDSSLDNEYLLDPVRLSQIINNLIGNALKFTEQGHVTLRAMPLAKAPDQVQARFREYGIQMQLPGKFGVYFCVEDTGIGISKEKIGHIFKAFNQSDCSITRKFGGTGLGLTISQMLIEKFSGDIWVDSVEGVGSQFHFFVFLKEKTTTFSLLDAVDSSPEQLSEEIPELTSLRVLLAEDNPINQKVAVRHIEKLGWSVVTVVNGKEALEILEKENFDVVLMDVNMPILDGREALRAIRNPDIAPDISGTPVIAMTAMTGKEEIRGLREDGFDEYIPKPFKSEILKSVILSTVMKTGKEK